MPIHWDDLPVLAAVDQLEGDGRAYHIDGEELMKIVAGDERCTDRDRIAFTQMLYSVANQWRLQFESKNYPGVAMPPAEDPAHLQWLWRFKLTESGRDRARARVVLEGRPDPDEDDGRLIPGLVLDRFAEIIASWYRAEQLRKFLRDSGLPWDSTLGAPQNADELADTFTSYEQGDAEHRRKLRRFLAAFLNGELDAVPDADQREQLIGMLAKAGWHLKDELVIGERVRSTIPASSPRAGGRTNDGC